MPARIIKETIRSSKTIDNLSWFEEVCFYRLLVTVDDYGCFYRDAQLLKSALFPRKGDLTVKSIDDAFKTLERESLIKSYWVSGERYLQVNTWEKHQRTRATKRKFPSPENESEGNESGLQNSAADCGKMRQKSAESGDVRKSAENCGNPPQSAASGGNPRPYSYSYSYSGEGEDARATPPPPLLPEEDALAIAQDHGEIFDRLRYVGFTLNQKLMDDAVNLYAEHGKDKLLQAIDKCAGASGNKWNYLLGVLKHWDEKKPVDDEPDELSTFNWL